MKTKRWTWEETGELSPQQTADRLNHTASVLDKMRGLVEQWRLEELREREDFPDEAQKVARCRHQLQPIVEQLEKAVNVQEHN